MRQWLRYAVTAGVVTVVGVLAVSAVLDDAAAAGVRLGAAVALALQLAAFAALAAVAGRPQLFLLGWAAGIGARFAALGGLAYWLSRDPVVPLNAALLGLVGFVFVLLLLEPLFLRRSLQTG